ncbi:hypothetical protein Ssi02_15670 [Sinosporangium siamense]|uniref:DUF6286 domain-containing protein n=1 Tax=Sinosporangium siamense TaxID=1367973 RepID=A0A919V5W8_9ACTN|nr:hypothetical protein Ssi02_15670 [Sinosporangium siamense]
MLRPSRAPLGVTVAVLLSAVLSLTAVEAVVLLVGDPPRLVPLKRVAAALWAAKWSDSAVMGIALLTALAGAVFVMTGLLPGRSRLMAVETTDRRTVIGVTRRGLRRSLRAVAQSVDGVERARVRLGHRHIEVTVLTGVHRDGHMLRQVGTAVGDRLAGVGIVGGVEVVVRLRRKKAR